MEIIVPLMCFDGGKRRGRKKSEGRRRREKNGELDNNSVSVAAVVSL